MTRVPGRIDNAERAFKNIISTLNGKVDIFDNIRCVIVDVDDTGTAGVAFTVNHNLGLIPTIYVYNIDRSGLVYDSSRATWTESSMTLKCSVNNAVLKLLIM